MNWFWNRDSYLSSDLTVTLDSVMLQRRSFIFLMIFACNCNIIFFNFLFYIRVASLSVGPVRRVEVAVAEESPLWLYQPAAQEPREPHHDGPGRRLQGDQRVCGWVSSFILSRIRAFNPNSNISSGLDIESGFHVEILPRLSGAGLYCNKYAAQGAQRALRQNATSFLVFHVMPWALYLWHRQNLHNELEKLALKCLFSCAAQNCHDKKIVKLFQKGKFQARICMSSSSCKLRKENWSGNKKYFNWISKFYIMTHTMIHWY